MDHETPFHRTDAQEPGFRRIRSPEPGPVRLVEARSWAEPEREASPTAWVAVPGAGLRRRYGFETAGHQQLLLSLTWEAVHAAGLTEPAAGYVRERSRPIGPHGSGLRLGRRDLERLETLRFRRGLALVAEQGPGYGILPVSWRFLAESPAVFERLNDAVRTRLDPHERLIAELTDIPAGVERSALRAAVARLSHSRRAVYLRLPPDSEALSVAFRSGARGLSLPLRGMNLASASERARLDALIRRARTLAPAVLLDGAPADQAERLWEAGATHAVFTRATPDTMDVSN